MSRRKPGELQIGSDSFLDVVCNLVGILIILIVIAGARISKAPPISFLSQSERAALTKKRTGDGGAGGAVSTTAVVPQDVGPDDIPIDPQFAAEMPNDDTPEIRRQIAELERDHPNLMQQLQQTKHQLAVVHERQSTLAERTNKVRSALDKTQAELQQAQQRAVSTAIELDLLRQQAAQLAEQMRTAQQAESGAQRIQHRITPLSKTVTKDELHFRVEHNRVSVVPLEPLLKRLREQIERRKDWLAKVRQQEGEVGPIDGFTLKYLVQRDNMSVVEELKYGSGMYRISVAHWEIELDRDVVNETVERALSPGSKFFGAVLEADSAAAFTFWVYPDSFDAYNRLKSFCHEQNFLVSARPMPAGMPIAGSPNGSRSAGQ